MIDEVFEELKRVCRIRGVPEPTEKPAPLKCFLVSAETVQAFLTDREIEQGRGAGFTVPDDFLRDGKVIPELLIGAS